MPADPQPLDEAIGRVREIAYRDEARRVSAATSDLRLILAEIERLRARVDEAEVWVTIKAERALIVDQGKETILLDRLPSPVTLLIKRAVGDCHD